MSDAAKRQLRELASNQGWEMLGAAAKALFVFVVTPVLLRRLGEDGFGFLALALSALTALVALDFGLRMRLRIALSAATSQPRALARSIGHYLALVALSVAIAAVAAHFGWWQRATGSSNGLLFAAVLGGGAYGLSLLLLEPLAARGRLSMAKAAAFAGSALTIPVLLALAASGASVGVCFVGQAAALTIPNLCVALFVRTPEVAELPRALASISPAGFVRSLRDGRWFALTAAEWLAKSYLLTFLAGLLLGPAAAGTYFILLKLSELVSAFGASASDTSTADLAALPDAGSRAGNFRASFSYSSGMCLIAFAGLACLGPLVLGQWLRLPLNDPALAVLAGAFGLAAAFHRVLLTACMGVALTHVVALWGLAEIAIVLGGSALLVPRFGLGGILAAGTLGSLALLPVARHVSRELGQGSWQVWVRPVAALVPAFAIATAGAWHAPITGFLVAASVGVYRLRQLQIKGAPAINS
ncbi:MAG: hypothetical protein ABMA13_06900 [Chthoniobacteraceae bacterium]